MQSYTEIPSVETLTNSRVPLLNNIKTAMSNSSGTAFPTENLQIGMFCDRTDLSQIYKLIDATPTWKLVFDYNYTATTKEYVEAAVYQALAKTTLADADVIGLNDSAASNVLKKITWANVKTAILGVVLTGLSTATNSAALATDTILVGIGKLQAQINNMATTIRGTVLTGLSTATNSAVIATDTLLVGIGKLQAQLANYLPLAGGTLTGQLKYAKGSAIASAATIDLSTATGNLVHITGSATITSFVITAGQIVDIVFDALPILTHSSSAIMCPAAANIQVAAGDRCQIVGESTNVAIVFNYQRSNGTALVGGVLAGQVVQVQSVLKDTTFSGSSGSWTDITGLSVAITPSSTANKVLVTANVSARGDQQNVIARLMRDTTAIAVSTGQTNNATFQFNDSEEAPTCSITFLDSPASTSAVTYKMQYKCPSGGSFNLNSYGDKGMVSGITVQEVKG